MLTDDATVTASDGELDLLLGDAEGRLWLDDIQFQAGSLGVWARWIRQRAGRDQHDP